MERGREGTGGTLSPAFLEGPKMKVENRDLRLALLGVVGEVGVAFSFSEAAAAAAREAVGSEPRRAGTGGLFVVAEGRKSARVGEVGRGGASSAVVLRVDELKADESLGVLADLLAILGFVSSFSLVVARVSSVISLFLFLRVRDESLLPIALMGLDAAGGGGEEGAPMTGGPARGDLGGGAKANEGCLVSFLGCCC